MMPSTQKKRIYIPSSGKCYELRISTKDYGKKPSDLKKVPSYWRNEGGSQIPLCDLS